MPNMARRLWLSTSIYAVVAAVVLAWAVAQIKPYELPELTYFLVFSMILSLWHIEVGSAIMPLSESMTSAAQLILPTALVVILDACVGAFVTIRRRRQPVDIVFNITNHIVPAYVVGTLYTVSGYREQFISWSGILAAAAVLITRYLLPLVIGSFYVAARDRKKPVGVLLGFLGRDGLGAPSGRIFAMMIMLAYPQANLPTLLFAFLVLLLSKHSSQLYVNRHILARSAWSDSLTEVGNRHAWRATLEELTERPQAPYLVAAFDLDGMKAVNDSLGHEVGDQVLHSFARYLAMAVGYNNVYRFGGDEFVVLLKRKQRGELFEVQKQLDDKIKEFVAEWAARNIHISASVGLAFATLAETIPDALRSADRAMYRHKRRNAR